MNRINSVDLPLMPKTLATVQAEVDELVSRINAVIDEGFELQQLNKGWIARKALIAELERALLDYNSQLDKLRDSYSSLCAKLSQADGKHRKKIVKLYHTLKSRYRREALQENCEIPPVREWEIPLAFKVPRPVIPSMDELSTVSSKLSRKLFSAMHHYRSRAHWTVRGAESRLVELRKISKHQELCRTDRERLHKIAVGNIDLADEEIKQYTDKLSLDKYSVWGDSYARYANLILHYFVEFENKKSHNAFKAIDNSLIGPETSTNYDFLSRGNRSIASPSYVSEVSEFRCMSGPDINEDPYSVTIPKHRNDGNLDADMRIEWSTSCSTFNMVPSTLIRDLEDDYTTENHFSKLPLPNTIEEDQHIIPRSASIGSIEVNSIEVNSIEVNSIEVNNDSDSHVGTPDTPVESVPSHEKHSAYVENLTELAAE